MPLPLLTPRLEIRDFRPVRTLLDFGFGELGAHRIYARVAPENEASSRVLLKHGFGLEGHLRKECFVRGEWQDSLLYAILEENLG